MNTRHSLLLAVLLAGCAHTTDDASSSAAAVTTDAELFTWPLPAQWSPETDPFPLSFAPTIPYQGVLELRFPPGFFTPSADTYFSYSYAWQLDGAVTFTAKELKADLTTYYAGLAQSADPARFDASVHHAEFTALDDTHFRGTIQTVDGFNASAPVVLHADVLATNCGGKVVGLFTMSPRPFDDATYTSLLAQRATLTCAK